MFVGRDTVSSLGLPTCPAPSLCMFHSYPLPLHVDHSWWLYYSTDERNDFTWDAQNTFPYSGGREGGREGPALTSLHLPHTIPRPRGSKGWSSVTQDRSHSAGRRIQPRRQTGSELESQQACRGWVLLCPASSSFPNTPSLSLSSLSSTQWNYFWLDLIVSIQAK